MNIIYEDLIPGACGDLEVIVSAPHSANTKQIPFSIVCHPHPLYGGAMSNKVVYTIANTFNELGAGAVCFNFRGVGKSVGKFDDGNGETEDLQAVAAWLTNTYQPSAVWIAGYSFGTYPALRAYQSVHAERLLLVAPNVARFVGLQLNQTPTLIIQGARDEVVVPDTVSIWVKLQTYQPQFAWLPEADHFFHGQLTELRKAILGAWIDYSSL